MNPYVIAAPAAITDTASWAPFADDDGMGYVGTLPDGSKRVVRFMLDEHGLTLYDDGVPVRSFGVGEP
jgi:hypothetical protein